MTAFFLSAAGFCAVYFVVLCVYARQLVAQSWIWLFFALVCLGNVLFRWLHARTPGKVSLFWLIQIHTLSFLGMAVLMASGLAVASGMHPKAKGQPEYAIVLGAGLKPDGSLSKTLKQRLDTALDFAAKSPETRFILSGGYDRRGQRTEAEVMAEYLIKQGLPKKRLVLEVQSKNTYENMVYSYALLHRVNNEDYPVFIEAEGRWVLLTTPDPDVVAVISSDFHLYRASAILEAQCDIQALGVPAPSDRVLFMHYLARESIALLKDKYLGRLNKRQSRERK